MLKTFEFHLEFWAPILHSRSNILNDWVLGLAFKIPNLEFWVPDPALKIHNSELWVQDPAFKIQNPESWVQVIYYIQDQNTVK